MATTPRKKRAKPSQWSKVHQSNGRRIRGLWKRGKVFYAQVNLADPVTGETKTKRHRLKARSEVDAQNELGTLKEQRSKGTLKITTNSSGFTDFAEVYLATIKPTINGENYKRKWSLLNVWKRAFENRPLNKITPQLIRATRNGRLEKVKPRTANIELVELRSVFKLAIEQKLIHENPAKDVKQLQSKSEPKRLIEREEIDKLVEHALTMLNGRRLGDFILLGAYCGGRSKELLSLTWDDVNSKNRYLHFPATITKNGKERYVHFNSSLEDHLKEMESRRLKDSKFLFPSNRNEGRIIRFNNTMRTLAEAVGIKFTAHFLRHYFISKMVMAGIDYLTIAKWVGHVDGGVLIGSTYGHLNNAHMEEMALKATNL